ncbi:hypothetical protein [Paenibacillus illinoisensis]|uniref:hypothetical protein n=1 Tax=Paenibacillus illinoisensis TaxID=59845 RepID=UPI00203B1366|nr:hypothetical protein [Paenibacillus illinoisensis]MCM3206413.1 hypothetical protein [Paenibacillus illinoisensis]
MTNEMVKFTAEVAKGISVGTKDVTIKLLIPLAAVESRLSSLAKLQEKEVMVYLGDPQAAFDFEDEDDRDPMYNTWNGGRRVTTDASGVVTRIEGNAEEERDENQVELFNEEGKQPEQQEEDGNSAEQSEEASQEQTEGEGQKTDEEGPESSDQQPSEDYVTDPNDPYGDDIPEWMKDDSQGQSEPKEMDFTSEETEGEHEAAAVHQEGGRTQPAGDPEGSSDEIYKDALEQYIITERPTFPDMPLDFPNLFEQKRDQGVTWREIANSVGLTSGQFSSKLTKYKERVKEAMAGSGVA